MKYDQQKLIVSVLFLALAGREDYYSAASLPFDERYKSVVLLLCSLPLTTDRQTTWKQTCVLSDSLVSSKRHAANDISASSFDEIHIICATYRLILLL